MLWYNVGTGFERKDWILFNWYREWLYKKLNKDPEEPGQTRGYNGG